MLIDSCLELYHLLSPTSDEKPEFHSCADEINHVNKPTSQPCLELQDKIQEYKTKIKDKISYSHLLQLLENLENLDYLISKKSNLLRAFKELSPDLTLARMELAQKRSS